MTVLDHEIIFFLTVKYLIFYIIVFIEILSEWWWFV